MDKMTRTAVIPKLLDPNLVYQIYFFNLEKCHWIYKIITKITYQMTKTVSKEQHTIK